HGRPNPTPSGSVSWGGRRAEVVSEGSSHGADHPGRPAGLGQDVVLPRLLRLDPRPRQQGQLPRQLPPRTPPAAAAGGGPLGPAGAWVILRLDGRGFSRFTEGGCEKPFDAAFHGWMVATARAVLEDFGGLYAYTESDEISVLLPRAWELFDREVEKAVSVSAGL